MIEIALALMGASGSREVAAVVEGWARRGLADALALFRYDETKRSLRRLGEVSEAPGPAIPLRELEWLLAGDVVHLVEGGDAPAALSIPWDAGWTHGLAAPLRDGSAVAGCLVVWWRSDDADTGWLRDASRLLGPALRRAVERDRVEREARILRAALPILQQGFMAVTSDGEVLHYNDGMERLTGWSADAVRARGWTTLAYPDAESRAQAHAAIAALVMGRPSEGTIRTINRGDGRTMRVEVWSAVARDPAGGAPALLGALRDVTAVAESTRSAIREENQLRLGRLASAVAHDFNNLLCVVMGHAELLTLRCGDAATLKSATAILVAARSGSQLARQLLAFGGSANIRARPVDVAAEVQRVIDQFSAGLSTGVSVAFDEGSSAPAAEADRGRLHQILLNLLANAHDAVGVDGHVRVSVDQAPMPEDCGYRSPHGVAPGTPMIRLRVADDGPGFTPEALQRLFEPFFSTKAKGHGIGLAAIQGLISGQRGAVRVYNDGGAVVEVFLPLSDRPEAVFPVLMKRADGSGRRIWMLDAEEQVLEFSRISLAAMGYDVRIFHREADLRIAARRGRGALPEALVLDLSTPGGGAALISRLREWGIQASVLWTSGYSHEAPPGADSPQAFLEKPYTGQDLAKAIERLLNGSEPE